MRRRLILSSLILFIIALGFNVFFTLTSLDKLYIESTVSQYRIIAKDLQRSLERGLRYGKSLGNFLGIECLLEETKHNISKKIAFQAEASDTLRTKFRDTDISLHVAFPDGEIIYSDSDNPLITRLPDPVLKNGKASNDEKNRASSEAHYTKYHDTYFTTLPIQHQQDQTVAGIIAISFNEKQIKAFLEDIFAQNIRPILMISACGIFLLILFLRLLTPKELGSKRFSKQKISLLIFCFIGPAQFLTCGLSTLTFKDHFLQLNKENAQSINDLLKRDVESLLQMNIRIDRLVKLDEYLGEIIGTSPELKDITLFDHTRQPLYRATKEGVTDFQRSKTAYPQWVEAIKPVADPHYNVQTDLMIDGKFKGYFSTNASKDILFDKLIDMGLDSLTVVVISMLFFVELLILIFKYIERQVEPSGNQATGVNYSVMRPAAFLFLFGLDLSVSFLPLHMETLYIPFFGLSKDTIMGLPISVEFLFVGISILASGVWLDRRGWHEPFLGGILLAGLGVLYSWLAPDALHFILSRAVVGLGYGLSLMASQGFVIRYSDWKSKAQGLAHLFAGIYAGSICGAATGGMLAEWMGYTPVFLIGAVILFSVVAYTLIFMRDGMKKPEAPVVKEQIVTVKGKRIFKFLLNRTILGLIFFSSLPAAIAVIGFLNYFSPIYLSRTGVSQSTIGQILMIYGICLIYFGPFISRFVDASNNKRTYVFLGCVLGSFALLVFYLLDGVIAAVIAVLLFGLSSSFVLASQSAYALRLKVTQQLGEGKAIGIFRSTSRIGQMLGPLVFSWIILATNANTGITYLGLAYLFTAFLFIVITEGDYKAAVVDGA